MNSKWFDPHKSFLNLEILWFVVGFFNLSAFISWVMIIHYSNIDFEFSYVGFNGFIDIFQVPLGILAIIIPIVALLAANHRSEQTKEQLRLTQEQNNFSNYYKHIEEFEKYCEGHKSEIPEINKPRQTYVKIFKESKNGIFSISQDSIQEVTKTVIAIAQHGVGLNSKDLAVWGAALFAIEEEIETLAYAFKSYISKSDPRNTVHYADGGAVSISGEGISTNFRQFFKLFKAIDLIFKFEPSYQTSKELSSLLHADLTTMPENKFVNCSDYCPFDLQKILGVIPEDISSIQ